jgi:hypothetical protein
MAPFITKLAARTDPTQVMQDLDAILDGTTIWEPQNQIGLKYRPGAVDQWKDATGSLYDLTTGVELAREEDFTEWCHGIPFYTRAALEMLERSEGVVLGRIRFMRAMPKTGLSMHVDLEQRYHLVLDTNPSAIFAECFKDQEVRCTGYHIPHDGHWYRVDTTREHFIYNGGWTPRIHLVADIAKNG